MSTTLVLGANFSEAMRYGEWLLRAHGDYTSIDGGKVGIDLASALLGSRRAVLLHGLRPWVEANVGPLVSNDLMDASQRDFRDRIEEVEVARRHVPFDVITIGHDFSWSAPTQNSGQFDSVDDAVSVLTTRLSATSDQVHLLIAGRVLDLTQSPLIPERVKA